MAAHTRAARRGYDSPAGAQTPEQRSVSKFTYRSDGSKFVQPQLGERVDYTPCPLCGDGDANATYSAKYGAPEWLVGCFSASCHDLGGDYLAALAEYVGAPSGAALKEDPRPYLAPIARSGRSTATGKETDLPSKSAFAGWAARLLASPAALAYLTDVRGIDREIIELFEIGWNGERLVLPMRRAGEIVAVKTRLPRPGAQMRCWPGQGRAWPLYPEPKSEWPWVLLLAGELDALRARSATLPACSVTLGAGAWREEWIEPLRGRFVVVLFDNNERRQARERVRALREAGVQARRLDLRWLGFEEPKADLSDYLNRGGSPLALRRAALRRSR